MTEAKNTRKCLVYGSLRNKEYNCKRFQNYYPGGFNYESTTTVKGFDLFDLGSYPGIKRSSNPDKELTVDIFNCSEECYRSIRAMELGAGYSELLINLEGVDHVIYLYNGNPTKLVESGDWSKYLSHEQLIEA